MSKTARQSKVMILLNVTLTYFVLTELADVMAVVLERMDLIIR